jgi:Holliday junction resolvase RusA-like endonuclease
MEVIKELCNITLPEDFNIKYINENEFNEKDVKKAIELYEKDKRENSYKELEFTIFGDTSAWKRAVHLKTHVFDPNVVVKNDTRMEVYRQLELLGYSNFIPVTGEVHLDLDVYRPIPKATPKYKKLLMEAGVIRPIIKPDTDNYIKLLSDTLNNILFKDDAQIVSEPVDKYYSFCPRMEFKIRFKELYLF